VRWHGDHDVVAQQLGQLRHVVALERVDVARQERFVFGIDGGVELVDGHRTEGGARPLQGAVHGRHARVEQVSHLGGLPLEHLTEDQHGTLPGGQVLERRDEGQTDRLARGGHLGRVAVDRDDALVGDGLHEGVLCVGGEDGGLDRGRRTEVHGPGPALRGPHHVDADVVGDPVEP
jgi:hypothetical protein